MTDIKLILNIQLFAEDGNGDAGENGECGMQNAECGVRNAECGKSIPRQRFLKGFGTTSQYEKE